MTPLPGGLKGVEGGKKKKKKKKRRLGRRDSRAGHLTGAYTLLLTGKERSDATSFASDVTGFRHPVPMNLTFST